MISSGKILDSVQAASTGIDPRRLARLISLIITTALLTTLAVPQNAVHENPDYIVEKDVAVPMRDGVTLRADVLRPKGSGPFPVLLYRTPYGKEEALKEYTTFNHAVERGYAIVVQDVRGRYASSGEFLAYQQEGHDGSDSIEWAARQPWSNGAVGTFGLSYPGAVQWLAAVENPPHLKAMVPAMTFSTPQNFFYAGGTWDMSWIDWIWDNIAPDVRAKKNVAGPKTYKEAIDAWHDAGPKMQSELPLSGLVELQGIAPYYYEWLKHPFDNLWWDWCELRNKYNRVHAAVLNFSGWYDDNYGPEGATTNFTGLLKSRSKDADARTHLIIGPWVHGVDATARTKSGQREFGDAAKIDYDDVVLRWMDHYVKGLDNGVEREGPVRYFVMGRNEWRDEKAWPPRSSPRPFYLSSEASTRKDKSQTKPGSLLEDLSTLSGYDSFVSDPANPVRNPYSASGAHDYRELSTRNDVLTYDSPVLDADLESTGPIHANIFFSCDCRDTDIWVRLLDVAPDGTALNLMSPGLDVLRASYRDLKRGRQLLEPNKIYEVQLTNLITSNVFLKGHRIRVQLSATFFPNFSRNLHTGELESTSARMQNATIRIYHDRKHPSRIMLPSIPGPGSK
jgi:uncharacterized protein